MNIFCLLILMADDAKIPNRKSYDVVPTRQMMNNMLENTGAKPPRRESQYLKRSSMPAPGEKGSGDDVFNDRALQFLKNINTGSPNTLPKTLPLLEPLQLVPSDTNPKPGFVRNQEEDIEICKVQTWVTSGVVKKSYKHCINNCTNAFAFTDRPWINLNEYPGRIIPSPIKDQLNEEFRSLYSHLDPKLTLSKLVNLREDLIEKVWKECGFDPVTLAIGLSYFDRLLNMNLVNKRNRKLYAAVCALLAFKFIEENHLHEIEGKKKMLMDHLYHMDKHDLLTTKMILEAEFSIYSYLNFSMHIKYEEIRDNFIYISGRLAPESD